MAIIVNISHLCLYIKVFLRSSDLDSGLEDLGSFSMRNGTGLGFEAESFKHLYEKRSHTEFCGLPVPPLCMTKITTIPQVVKTEIFSI